MEEVTIIIYKVGGYLFDNKSLAEELDKKLKDNVNKIICPTCCGTCQVESLDSHYDYWTDVNIFTKKKIKCKTCKDGTLTKTTKTEWV